MSMHLSIPTSSAQFAVICKTGRAARWFLLQLTDRDMKYYRSQDKHLRDSTCNQSPGKCEAFVVSVPFPLLRDAFLTGHDKGQATLLAKGTLAGTFPAAPHCP